MEALIERLWIGEEVVESLYESQSVLTLTEGLCEKARNLQKGPGHGNLTPLERKLWTSNKNKHRGVPWWPSG